MITLHPVAIYESPVLDFICDGDETVLKHSCPYLRQNDFKKFRMSWLKLISNVWIGIINPNRILRVLAISQLLLSTP